MYLLILEETAVREIAYFTQNMQFPSPPSEKIRDMKCGLKKNTLSEVMRVCNKHLIPSVLCPWGESEYIHMCGNISYDSVIQRYLPRCYIHKHCQDKACEKVYSSRPDYIRDEMDDI